MVGLQASFAPCFRLYSLRAHELNKLHFGRMASSVRVLHGRGPHWLRGTRGGGRGAEADRIESLEKCCGDLLLGLWVSGFRRAYGTHRNSLYCFGFWLSSVMPLNLHRMITMPRLWTLSVRPQLDPKP